MESGSALARARAVERTLVGLRGIRKARVDISSEDDVSIEVLAVPERSEQSLRAQITSVTKSLLGPQVTISAIDILSAARRVGPGAQQPRRKLSSLITRRTHDRFATQVILSRGGDVATGESECSAGTHLARSVAQAVIDGLYDVADKPLELQEVETLQIGEQSLVIVSLTLGERSLLGTAEVRFDLPDAVVRATLQALNRSITHA